MHNQKGSVPPLILVAILVIIGFLAFSFFAPFKNSLLTSLYPKPTSEASQKNPDKYEPDTVLIKFKDNVSEADQEQILKEHEGSKKEEIKQIKVKLVKVPNGKVLEKVEKLKNNPKVEFVEPNGIGSAEFTPNDPDYPKQWHLPKIGAPVAWDSANGTGITIAIADTGVDSAHPDLAANIVPGWNVYNNNSDTSDIQGHGTGVAGTAAAVFNNSNRVSSIAGRAKIMPIRIAYLNADGQAWASWYDMAEAITYAADNGAKIVNVSYQKSSGNSTVRTAADYMVNKGGITVFSESNTGANSGYTAYQNIVSVSATDSSDKLASWSTFGNDVDVSAPGVGILATTNGGGTGSWNGTSFSSPLAAGVLALIWQANPSLTPAAAIDILTKSADDLGTPGWDIYFGWGRINATKAVALAKGEALPSATPSSTSAPTQIPTATPIATSTPVPSSKETTLPTVSITYPVNESTVPRNSNVILSASASDNIAIAKVEFFVDNSLKCTDTTATYSCSTKIGGKPGASHTLLVKAYDTSGNVSQTSVSVVAQ